MEKLGGEIREVFKRWQVGVLLVSVATAVGGAVFAPSEDASAADRLVAAAAGAGAALVAVFIIVLALVLARTSLGDYRRRHWLQRIGQECMDIAYEMLLGGAIKGTAASPEWASDERQTAALARYSREFGETEATTSGR